MDWIFIMKNFKTINSLFVTTFRQTFNKKKTDICSKVSFFMVGRTDRVKLGKHPQKKTDICSKVGFFW